MIKLRGDIYQIVKKSPQVVIEARRRNPVEAQDLRNQFDYNCREAFRKAHPASDGSTIHHILPLSFGGDNSWDNLTMIEPGLHIVIHDWLDWQSRGMMIGDQRTLRLPYVPGKYWRITQRNGLKHG